jgi:hypothetical protein
VDEDVEAFGVEFVVEYFGFVVAGADAVENKILVVGGGELFVEDVGGGGGVGGLAFAEQFDEVDVLGEVLLVALRDAAVEVGVPVRLVEVRNEELVVFK